MLTQLAVIQEVSRGIIMNVSSYRHVKQSKLRWGNSTHYVVPRSDHEYMVSARVRLNELITDFGDVAQVVEQWSHKPLDPISSIGVSTKFKQRG